MSAASGVAPVEDLAAAAVKAATAAAAAATLAITPAVVTRAHNTFVVFILSLLLLVTVFILYKTFEQQRTSVSRLTSDVQKAQSDLKKMMFALETSAAISHDHFHAAAGQMADRLGEADEDGIQDRPKPPSQQALWGTNRSGFTPEEEIVSQMESDIMRTFLQQQQEQQQSASRVLNFPIDVLLSAAVVVAPPTATRPDDAGSRIVELSPSEAAEDHDATVADAAAAPTQQSSSVRTRKPTSPPPQHPQQHQQRRRRSAVISQNENAPAAHAEA